MYCTRITDGLLVPWLLQTGEQRILRHHEGILALQKGHAVSPKVPLQLEGRREGAPANAAYILSRTEWFRLLLIYHQSPVVFFFFFIAVIVGLIGVVGLARLP